MIDAKTWNAAGNACLLQAVEPSELEAIEGGAIQIGGALLSVAVKAAPFIAAAVIAYTIYEAVK